jgi:hypothetical protein
VLHPQVSEFFIAQVRLFKKLCDSFVNLWDRQMPRTVRIIRHHGLLRSICWKLLNFGLIIKEMREGKGRPRRSRKEHKQERQFRARRHRFHYRKAATPCVIPSHDLTIELNAHTLRVRSVLGMTNHTASITSLEQAPCSHFPQEQR